MGFAQDMACELGFSSRLEKLLQNIYGVQPLDRNPKRTLSVKSWATPPQSPQYPGPWVLCQESERTERQPQASLTIAHEFLWVTRSRALVPGSTCEEGSEDILRRAPKSSCHQPFHKTQPRHCEPQFPPVQNKIHKALFQLGHWFRLALKKHPELAGYWTISPLPPHPLLYVILETRSKCLQVTSLVMRAEDLG